MQRFHAPVCAAPRGWSYPSAPPPYDAFWVEMTGPNSDGSRELALSMSGNKSGVELYDRQTNVRDLHHPCPCMTQTHAHTRYIPTRPANFTAIPFSRRGGGCTADPRGCTTSGETGMGKGGRALGAGKNTAFPVRRRVHSPSSLRVYPCLRSDVHAVAQMYAGSMPQRRRRGCTKGGWGKEKVPPTPGKNHQLPRGPPELVSVAGPVSGYPLLRWQGGH